MITNIVNHKLHFKNKEEHSLLHRLKKQEAHMSLYYSSRNEDIIGHHFSFI